MKRALIVVNMAGFLCFLWNDIKVLNDMGYSVSVAANGRRMDGSLAVELEQLKKMGIVFYQIDFNTKKPFTKQNIIALRQVKSILKENTYDLIHCHTSIVGIIVRIAANQYRKKFNTKVIYTSHGFAFTDQSSKKTWFVYYNAEKLISHFTDAIITINHEDYRNAKMMHCQKVFYIPGVGVDTDRFHKSVINRDQYRASLGVPKDKLMILSVGELSKRKNHQIVIKALGLLSNKQNYVYVICGHEIVDSGIRKYLIQLAKENNVQLVLLGHRADTPQINKCADIAVIPSIREGLGLAGIEALAAGIPVIGANVQGIRDYIKESINGYLCSPYSDKAFADAIRKLTGKAQRNKMKLETYKSVQKFDIKESDIAKRTIFKNILS